MRGGAAVLLLAALVAADVGAETVPAEGVGTAPLPGASARTAGLDAALADAVRRVALELVGGAPSAAGEAAVREALGRNPARYAASYRLLSEEQRTRPDGGGRELAVRVEASVDRSAVAEALRRAGLLASRGESSPAAAAVGSLLVVEPVPRWPVLQAFQKRLVELGAARVTLERVEPERVRLRLEGARNAESLARAAAQSPPPGTSVTPDGELDGVPRVRLDEAPLAPVGAPGLIDTPRPKR